MFPLLGTEESPLPEGTPTPPGSAERTTDSPEDMRLAVPVSLEKAPASGRDWGAGGGVGERPGLGPGEADARGASCLVQKGRCR